MKRIYLDNHSAARPSSSTVKEMVPYLRDHFTCLSSPYQPSQEQMEVVQEAYTALYRLLGAKEEDSILFCSSGAEAINHILLSTYFDVTRKNGKNHYIAPITSDAPVMMGMMRLEPHGVVAKFCSVDHKGVLTKQDFIEAITPRTALVSLSLANGLTGVVQPINEIQAICKDRGIILHIDVSYALGKLFFDLEELQADYITCSGEPLHAPRGSGFLYAKATRHLAPLIVGGGDQAGLRAGPVNVAALIGLGNAALELLESQDIMGTEIARLRDQFEDKILEAVPQSHVLFQDAERLPNCTTIAFPSIFNEALLYLLNRKGVYATMGGASLQNITSLLRASGQDDLFSKGAISFSLSRDTTEEEIDLAVDAVVSSVLYLRKVSKGIV